MSKLYIMVGIPGSGKSTAAARTNATIVSSDAIRKELYGDESIQGDGQLVFKIVDERVLNALKNGEDVVYDATSITARTRKSIIAKFRDYADEIICVFVDTPLKLALKRNKYRDRIVPRNVIESMHNRLEAPSTKEGFDTIIYV